MKEEGDTAAMYTKKRKERRREKTFVNCDCVLGGFTLFNLKQD